MWKGTFFRLELYVINFIAEYLNYALDYIIVYNMEEWNTDIYKYINNVAI